MTNVEIMVARAVKMESEGLLNEWEKSFVNSIKDFSKKQLKALTSKQYNALRKIYEKAID